MVFDVQYPSHVIRSQRKTSLMLALFGSIPLSIGKKLRGFAYRSIFRRLGADVTFETGLDLAGSQGISIGNRSYIARDVFLNCWTPDSQVVIHDRAVLDRGVYFNPLGGCIEVDDMAYIGPYVCIAGPGDIKIGKNCLIASHSSMYANSHNFTDLNIPINQQGLSCKGISIEDDCWLGTGVRVLDGVTIGRGSVVGAGAVVTKSLPPYSIAVGVPARVIDLRDMRAKSQSLAARN